MCKVEMILLFSSLLFSCVLREVLSGDQIGQLIVLSPRDVVLWTMCDCCRSAIAEVVFRVEMEFKQDFSP